MQRDLTEVEGGGAVTSPGSSSSTSECHSECVVVLANELVVVSAAVRARKEDDGRRLGRGRAAGPVERPGPPRRNLQPVHPQSCRQQKGAALAAQP